MKKALSLLTVTLLLLSSCSHFQSSVDNVSEPILKEEPKLIYPVNAQQNSWYGTTTIIFTITKEGIVDKTQVTKSSGHKDLDNAAENYCKGLVFIPAKQNGEAIPANMKWDVKFDLKDLGKEIKVMIEDAKDLYSEINNEEGIEKYSSQRELLNIHKNIAESVKDCIKFNEYLYSVVREDLANEWQPVSELYPLTFLLYHDFISRFPDYDSIATVKSYLERALSQDIDYLNNSDNVGYDYKINKEVLINKIQKLVESKYPEINFKDILSQRKEIKNSIS